MSALPVSAPGTERAPVSRGFIAVYVVAYLGLYLAVMTPILASFAIHLERIDPDRKETYLGLVVGVGTLVGLIAGPVIGRFSDLTTSRWGRRRPWIVAGMPLLLAGALLAASGDDVGTVLAGNVVAQLGIAGIMTGLQAILPDQVPERQRGAVAGFVGFTAQISGVIGFGAAGALKGSPYLMFGLPAGVCCALVLAAVLILPDPAPAPVAAQRPRLDLGGLWKSYTFSPRLYPDLGWTWGGRFLMQFSLTLLATYQVYFLTDRLGYDLDEAAGLLAVTGGVGLLMTSSGAIVSGLLSDRLGRRKIFIYAAAGLFAAGFCLLATAHGFPQMFAGCQVILLGAGLFGAVDLALVTDVIPNKETQAARYMGVFGIASALPQAAAPVLAPVILAVGGGRNYPLLFAFGAVVAVLAGFTVRPVKGVR